MNEDRRLRSTTGANVERQSGHDGFTTAAIGFSAMCVRNSAAAAKSITSGDTAACDSIGVRSPAYSLARLTDLPLQPMRFGAFLQIFPDGGECHVRYHAFPLTRHVPWDILQRRRLWDSGIRLRRGREFASLHAAGRGSSSLILSPCSMRDVLARMPTRTGLA